ncbi:TetR/AcrR family transcriptional regulator [Nocardioides sp. R-C-SC26]|uniref:TetR/AcrR family transcriptional regulator n=1 Tax=Nocardioides sp. R-C-SC26 TaxID=2870414 RepID=UPI001E34AAD8|nr:TetR/AcrR family transcriptional regulator [Nocardioides sp. R-C-SC26]
MGRTQDGRQLRWDHHNQQRRQQILSAAIEVIESGEPGEEFHVQQIAERAGLNRTVVYRHFADRSDLDAAIRAQVVENFTELLTPAVSLEGTINEIVLRIVATYVDWTVEHPKLHAFAVVDGGNALEMGLHRIAGSLVDLLDLAIAMLGLDLDEDEQALVDPLAHGLVGAVFGTVGRWVARAEHVPPAGRLSELLALSIWNLLDGHLRRLGVEVDPSRPLVDVLGIPAEFVDGATA